MNKLALFIPLTSEHCIQRILKHIQFSHWIWGIHAGLFFFLISNFLSFLQFEAASKQYQFVPSPSEASRCLEQAGMFRKAIAILEDSHFYDRAIDCLRRYQIKIEVIIITSIYLYKLTVIKKGFKYD